jgi:hypothetical protein
MKKTLASLLAAATIALTLTATATDVSAQMGHSKGGGKLGQKSDEQRAAEQQIKKNEENAYRDALKKIPDQAVKPTDPWASTR